MTNGIKVQIQRAQNFLQLLQFDNEQANERSALVLLALLQLKPADKWQHATPKNLRTLEIMAWIRDHYQRDYKPNSRETIRRQTLHQFASAALILQNPDDPLRPVNSPKWCYRIAPLALRLVQSCSSATLPQKRIHEYVEQVPSLRTQYAVTRDMQRIPVSLPNGRGFQLSPGGQNTLLKSMIEDFCANFVPGGEIIYVGDADAKWAIFEEAALRNLGVIIDQHGKMPDLIVYSPKLNWLVLLEAASSHGPVDAKRHKELSDLFVSSKAGLVYVSCFPSRTEMRKFLADIAWETEVWCADNPTHLIHFNGERFLGPY